MDLRNPARAICFATAISVALAAPALGAPAADEYLPKVPKATGNSAAHDQSSGTSATASASGSAESQPQPSAASTENGPGKGNGKRAKKSADAASAPVSGAPAPSSDDSSDSTLLSPVVILLIAGVIIAAVGMTLRRRNADGPERQGKPGSGRPEPGKTPPTPDGEIVAGGDGPR